MSEHSRVQLSLEYSPFRSEALMEWSPFEIKQRAFKNRNNCLNTNISSYLETSGIQSSNIYLNVVHFFNTSINWTSVAP